MTKNRRWASPRGWGVLLGASVAAVVAVATTRASDAPSNGREPGAPPTFAADVAPVLERECVSCHNPEGSAPFSLDGYDAARERADRIARAVERHVMPPWLPDAEPGTFQGERRVTPEEITTLRQWADAGAPAGDLGSIRRAPERADEWRPGEPDLVIELPTFMAPAGGEDIYRNLVAPIPVADTRWVDYVELRPGESNAVHHARMMVDTTASSRVLDGQDESPGFDGMRLRSNATDPDGHFVGWTPGKTLLRPLDGMAWRLDPGTDLVVQLHLQPAEQDEVVEAEVALHFADEPPRRRPAVLVVSSLMIDIPAGDPDHVVTNGFTLPVGVDVLSVYPHAHYLATDLRATAILPDGGERELIHIPDWDFDWQDEYRYTDPVRLPAGSTIAMEYTYDNSSDNPRNPASPPERVVYGSASTDEMADLILQVLPRNEEDRRTLLAEQAWQHESEDMAYVAQVAYAAGEDALVAGRLDEARELFQEALRNRSDHIGAMVGLSRILRLSGDVRSAEIVARQAVAVSGGRSAQALAELAEALHGAGRRDEAVAAAREAESLARRAGELALADTLAARLRRYGGG